MRSAVAKSSIVLAAFGVLIFGAPAFAQSQPSGSGDLFSDVPAVDSDQMSAVSGELVDGIGIGPPAGVGTGECGGGAACGAGMQGNAAGTGARSVSGSGASVRINVTAINNQTSIGGPGAINSSGGRNAAGAN